MKQINTRKSLRNFQLAGFIGLIVVGGVVGVWAAKSSIQGAIIAQGVTTVESHSKKVQHREGGIVAKISVKDGDKVKAGELLVQLDETEIQASLAIIDGNLAELQALSGRLIALRDGSDKISFPKPLLARKGEVEIKALMVAEAKLLKVQQASQKGRQAQLLKRVTQLNEQISGFKSQTASRNLQMKLISKELVNLEKLFKKGLVPASRVLALRRDKSSLEGQKGGLVARVAEAKSKISETQLQIIQLDDDARTKTLSELRDATVKQNEARERRIAIAARLKRMVIRAPQSGFIHQLNIHTVGGVIGAGETVMLIVPELDNLIIEARITPQDIDQVQVGQPADIRFSAFNQRTTPQVGGKVIYVSADLTQPQNNLPPYFAIKLRLNKGAIEKLGDNKLIPGMPAEAFVQTRSRSPMSYLLQPLKDQVERAFREE